MRLLLDENVEKALLLGVRRRHPGLDVVRVVDVGLGGRSDPEILEWAAREGRVVVSRDRATLSAEAARRIEGGKAYAGAHPPRAAARQELGHVDEGGVRHHPYHLRFKDLSTSERGQVVALGLIVYARYEQPLEPEELEGALEEMERVAVLIERTPDPVWRLIKRIWGR